MASSTDGYCTVIGLTQEEMGVVYTQEKVGVVYNTPGTTDVNSCSPNITTIVPKKQATPTTDSNNNSACRTPRRINFITLSNK